MRSNLNKKTIIISGICLILVIILLITFLFLPKIEIDIIGKSSSNIEVGTEYKEQGVKAYIKNIFSKKEIKVEIISNLDINKLGRYKITYIAKDNGVVKKRSRNVKVIDTTKPTIEMVDQVKACKNNQLVNINAQAHDNYDGDLTSKIKYYIEKEVAYISVTDSSNNKTEIKENLNYIDEERPKIILNGSQVIYLNLNEEYIEYGATAEDSCDGNLTKKIKITGEVDNTRSGTYLIKYQVKDSYGNSVDSTRKVVVSDNNQNKVTNGNIYLTFDDGPGQYTESYLNLLAQYNIKATFFVTGQFPKYFDLITREYKEGHTIVINGIYMKVLILT